MDVGGCDRFEQFIWEIGEGYSINNREIMI